MKKLFFTVPCLLATFVVAPLVFAGNGGYDEIQTTCDNPTEQIDPVTYEIYKSCEDPLLNLINTPSPEYNYFQQEYSRITGNISNFSQEIEGFQVEIADLIDSEKRMAYENLLSSVSEYSSLYYDIQNLSSSFDTNLAEEKVMVKNLSKERKILEKKVKALKKTLNLLSQSEFNTIESVNESFTLLSENIIEAKEIYSLLEPDLSNLEKKNAKKALRIVDTLYTKAKKQALSIKELVLALPADKDPWTVQSKYNATEYRITTVLDKFTSIVLGSGK